MREIKFRGKDANGKWVYGSYIYQPVFACCFPQDGRTPPKETATRIYLPETFDDAAQIFSVDPATVGQFTDFYDDDDSEKEIYEGDIVKAVEKLYKVEFHNAQFELRPVDSSDVDFYITLEKARRIGLRLEVVGNVFDNSELFRREIDNAGN